MSTDQSAVTLCGRVRLAHRDNAASAALFTPTASYYYYDHNCVQEFVGDGCLCHESRCCGSVRLHEPTPCANIDKRYGVALTGVR